MEVLEGLNVLITITGTGAAISSAPKTLTLSLAAESQSSLNLTFFSPLTIFDVLQSKIFQQAKFSRAL